MKISKLTQKFPRRYKALAAGFEINICRKKDAF